MKKTKARLNLKRIKISKLTNLTSIVGGSADGDVTTGDTTEPSPTTHTTLNQMSQNRNACAVGNGGS